MTVQPTRHSRRREREPAAAPERIRATGGRYAPLDTQAVLSIERAAFQILATLGLSDATPRAVSLVCAAA